MKSARRGQIVTHTFYNKIVSKNSNGYLIYTSFWTRESKWKPKWLMIVL